MCQIQCQREIKKLKNNQDLLSQFREHVRENETTPLSFICNSLHHVSAPRNVKSRDWLEGQMT